MRVFPALLIAVSVSLCVPVWAAAHLDASTSKQLSRLELQYFKHNFDSDPDDTRIQRLEKLVFGQAVTGEAGTRVKNLVSAAAEATSSDPELSPATPSAPATASTPNAPATAPPTAALPPRAPSRRSVTAPDSTVPLVPPSQKQSHLPNAGFSVPAAQIADAAPPESQAKYPRITTLENDILGQTFETDALSARLTRMETKAFGHPASGKDLSDRTDALEAYASKKLHKKTLEQQEISENGPSKPQQQQQQSGGFGQKLVNMVEKSILGMGGSGAGPGGGATAMGPGFGPGMGMGMGPGFGGMGMRRHMMQQQQQQQQPQQPESKPAPKPEDPALYSSNPPPPNARMATQVGWCEVQVFGKTFPEKHLPERLGQLNRELQYKPGETDIALMDDMNGLIKAVQVHSNRAIGASPTSGIR